MIYLCVLPMTLLGALGAFFFKRASARANGIAGLMKCGDFYLGGFLYVASALCNILLLRYAQYSILYPMTSITYIWTAIMSHAFLNERIDRSTIAGIALIIAGVILLAQG